MVSKSSKAAESDSAPALSQRVFSPLSPGWGQVGLLEEASRAGQEKNGSVLVIVIVGVGGQLAEMIKIFSSQPKYFPEKSGRVGGAVWRSEWRCSQSGPAVAGELSQSQPGLRTTTVTTAFHQQLFISKLQVSLKACFGLKHIISPLN